MNGLFRQISEAKDAAAVGVVLAAAACVGFTLDRWDGDIGSVARVSALVAGFVVLSGVLALAIAWLYRALDASAARAARRHAASGRSWKLLEARDGTLSGGKLLVVLLVAWTPWLLASLPGTPSYDFIWQLSIWRGEMPANDHHPYLTTLLLGGFYQIGYLAGGEQAGLASVVVFQSVLLAAALSLGLKWLDRLGSSRKVTLGALAVFALWPLFPAYGQWCVKNTLATAAFFLFVLQAFAIVAMRVRAGRGGEAYVRTSWFESLPVLVATGLLCCLTRHDGVFVVAPTLVVMFVWFRRDARARRFMASATAAVLALLMLWQCALIPALGIAKGSSSAVLSVAYQQIAATVKSDPGYFNGPGGEEVERLLKQGATTENLAAAYNPELADDARALYSAEPAEVVSVCCSLAARYPVVNAAAFARDTIGYWYPLRDPALYVESDPVLPMLTSIQAGPATYDLGDVHELHPFAKTLAHDALDFLEHVPLLGLLSVPAAYAWACLVLGVYALTRRLPGRIVVVPAALLFAICCASPLNGSVRYALPLLLFAFLMLADATRAREEQGFERESRRR